MGKAPRGRYYAVSRERIPTGRVGDCVVALAGGVGAGRFLRGLVRVLPAEDITVVVNTADDCEVHGLHVSPDIDSVTYQEV